MGVSDASHVVYDGRANGGAADELTKRIPRILALADERRVILRVTVGEIAWPAWLAEEAASHFKPCACVRLFLSELLPSDWNAGKVLYVDTDVLFVADPLQIYADAVASLNGGFVAAAAEHGDVVEPSADAYYNASGSHLPRAWLDDGANTGILALDLDRARSTNLSAWLVDARKALDDSEIAVDFGDQGWLNALLGGAALYLPEAGRLRENKKCVHVRKMVFVVLLFVVCALFCMNAPGLSQEVLALQRCLLLFSSFAGLAGKPAKATCDEEAPAERTQLKRRG